MILVLNGSLITMSKATLKGFWMWWCWHEKEDNLSLHKKKNMNIYLGSIRNKIGSALTRGVTETLTILENGSNVYWQIAMEKWSISNSCSLQPSPQKSKHIERGEQIALTPSRCCTSSLFLAVWPKNGTLYMEWHKREDNVRVSWALTSSLLNTNPRCPNQHDRSCCLKVKNHTSYTLENPCMDIGYWWQWWCGGKSIMTVCTYSTVHKPISGVNQNAMVIQCYPLCIIRREIFDLLRIFHPFGQLRRCWHEEHHVPELEPAGVYCSLQQIVPRMSGHSSQSEHRRQAS